MKISVIGAGYVGVTIAACLSDLGNELYLIDRFQNKVDKINKGILPFYEPGLDGVLQIGIRKNKIKATLDYGVIDESDIVFLCVGTPEKEDGSIDLSEIESASVDISKQLKRSKKYKVITVKSTVVPGTTKNIVKPILESYSDKKVGKDFGLCMNPEFLREGSAVYDFLNPDKIVIGAYDEKSYSYLEKLYEPFDKKIPRIKTTLTTAEIIKHTQNAFLATKVSFINEIANLCEKLSKKTGDEVDVCEVAYAIGLDERIGHKFLNAGCGYGGSCLPKDVNAMISYASSLGYEPIVLKAVVERNKSQPYRMVELTKEVIGNVNGKTVAVLGLSFKPNTDDIREAPSLKIIRKLKEEGARVKVYDPKAMENVRSVFGNDIEYSETAENCVKDSDVCLVVTEWDEFKRLDLKSINCPIIDGRRVLDAKEVKKRGITYRAIGYGVRE